MQQRVLWPSLYSLALFPGGRLRKSPVSLENPEPLSDTPALRTRIPMHLVFPRAPMALPALAAFRLSSFPCQRPTDASDGCLTPILGHCGTHALVPEGMEAYREHLHAHRTCCPPLGASAPPHFWTSASIWPMDGMRGSDRCATGWERRDAQ
jgi:hypothetical protein